ncbi:zinc finger BED domain-containing protein RICESLEEPER 2 [Tanacetum coccineum]
MQKRSQKMASRCGQSLSFVGVGDPSTNLTVMAIKETNKDPMIWSNCEFLCDVERSEKSEIDLLTVHASMVALESTFSFSDNVISPRRTKLTPLSVEVCICLKDHLDNMEMIQYISPLEGGILRVKYEIQEEEIAMRYGTRIFESKRSGGGRGVKEKNQVLNNVSDEDVVIPLVVDEPVLSSLDGPMAERVTMSGNSSGTRDGNVDSPYTTQVEGNRADVVIPLESIKAISEPFVNTAYSFFLGKWVAYPVVAKYVRNT